MPVICMDISIGRRARYGISSAGTCSTTEQSHKCFTVGRCSGAMLEHSTLVTGRRLLHVGEVEFCPDSGYRLGPDAARLLDDEVDEQSAHDEVAGRRVDACEVAALDDREGEVRNGVDEPGSPPGSTRRRFSRSGTPPLPITCKCSTTTPSASTLLTVARSAGSFEPTRTRPSACNGILSVIPLIAAFIFLQRFWQSGLTAGGVKE